MATKKQKSWAECTGVRLPRTSQEAASEAARKNRESADKKAAADKAHADEVARIKKLTDEAKKRAVRNNLNPTAIYRALNQAR